MSSIIDKSANSVSGITQESLIKFIKSLDEGFELLDLIFDKQGNVVDFVFLYVNPAFEKQTGLKAVDIIGKRKKENAPTAEERWYDYAVQAVKTRKTLNYQYYNSKVSRYFETRFIPISASRITVLFKDITEHKKAEEALFESEEKYEQLVDKLPEMVFELDNRGRVVFANSRAIETIGYSKEELEKNFDANRFVAAEDVERSRENMKKMFAGGIRHSNEYMFVKKDGTRFPVLITSAPIVKEGKVLGARGIVVDLTQQKETERRLKENERLATIGQTAGMVGHDIRNPLQAIAGDLYLIENDVASLPEGETKECLQESVKSIQDNLLYIGKIVEDLQDYAKPLKPNFERVRIDKVIEDVMLLMGNVTSNHRVNIDVEEGFPEIVTDFLMLKRALTNLTQNAIQAMPDGGQLTLRADHKGTRLFICVEDTGDGIPEEVKPKLFTPMVTTKAKGQGLGLAVVKRLVEALNGTIAFESQLGKGTKFIIELTA